MKTFLPYIPEKDALICIQKMNQPCTNPPQRDTWEVPNSNPRLSQNLEPPLYSNQKIYVHPSKTKNQTWWQRLQKTGKGFYQYLSQELTTWYENPPVFKAIPTLLIFVLLTLLLLGYQWYIQGGI